jgi:hypothetical protein
MLRNKLHNFVPRIIVALPPFSPKQERQNCTFYDLPRTRPLAIKSVTLEFSTDIELYIGEEESNDPKILWKRLDFDQTSFYHKLLKQ